MVATLGQNRQSTSTLMSSRAYENALNPRNKRHFNSMSPITATSTTAITAPTIPHGKPAIKRQNQVQKSMTDIPSASRSSEAVHCSLLTHQLRSPILTGRRRHSRPRRKRAAVGGRGAFDCRVRRIVSYGFDGTHWHCSRPASRIIGMK
jgi:hypothetical protein